MIETKTKSIEILEDYIQVGDYSKEQPTLMFQQDLKPTASKDEYTYDLSLSFEIVRNDIRVLNVVNKIIVTLKGNVNPDPTLNRTIWAIAAGAYAHIYKHISKTVKDGGFTPFVPTPQLIESFLNTIVKDLKDGMKQDRN